MGLRDKLTQRYTKSYLKKYGDRLTQVQGNVVSVKLETKTILWLYHKMLVTVVVRPEKSKSIVKCTYERKRWFKKPEFMAISQGNLVLIQGMKGKKGKDKKDRREAIQIMNVMNLTTHKDLVKSDNKPKRVQKVQRIK